MIVHILSVFKICFPVSPLAMGTWFMVEEETYTLFDFFFGTPQILFRFFLHPSNQYCLYMYWTIDLDEA